MKLNQVEFAERLEIAQATISRWETGEREPGDTGYLRMALIALGQELVSDYEEFLRRAGLPLSQLTTLLGVMRRRVTETEKELIKAGKTTAVPVLHDAVAAGPPRQIDPRDIDRYVPMLPDPEMVPHPGEVVVIPVEGDSMAPLLQPGYLVAIDTHEVEPARLRNQMVAARDPEGGVTVKWLRHSQGEYFLIPQHTSPRHQPALITRTSGWKIIGRVLWWIGMPPR